MENVVEINRDSIAGAFTSKDLLAGTDLDPIPTFGTLFIYGRSTLADVLLSARTSRTRQLNGIPLTVDTGNPKKPDDHVGTINDLFDGAKVIIDAQNTNAAANVPSIRFEFLEMSEAELEQAAVEAGVFG